MPLARPGSLQQRRLCQSADADVDGTHLCEYVLKNGSGRETGDDDKK